MEVWKIIFLSKWVISAFLRSKISSYFFLVGVFLVSPKFNVNGSFSVGVERPERCEVIPKETGLRTKNGNRSEE